MVLTVVVIVLHPIVTCFLAFFLRGCVDFVGFRVVALFLLVVHLFIFIVCIPVVVQLFVSEAVPAEAVFFTCLLYTSPSPRDLARSRMPSSA